MKVKEESEIAGLKLNIQKMMSMASGPIISCKKMEKQWKQWQTLFSWAPKSLQMVTSAMKLKDACSLEENNQPRQYIKKQRHYLANKHQSSQCYGFSSIHVWMWDLDHKENWVPKNWCFWTVALGKTFESLWTARRSNQTILKEISPDIHWKDSCYSCSPNNLATWCEDLTL